MIKKIIISILFLSLWGCVSTDTQKQIDDGLALTGATLDLAGASLSIYSSVNHGYK